MVVPDETGASTPYFSPQIASGAKKMTSVYCCSCAALLFSGYVTSEVLGFCVLALPGLTFSVSVGTSEGSAAWGGDMVVIQEEISARTVSYLRGPNPKEEISCANGMHDHWTSSSREQCA